jgi:hypothetical protein
MDTPAPKPTEPPAVVPEAPLTEPPPVEPSAGETTLTEPSPDMQPNDVVIHCMTCDYNVTYTPQERCPECGQPFNRAALVEWTTGRDQPLPFGRAQPHTFLSIFRASLFTPSKLGRQLPPYPNLGQAILYSLAMKTIATGFIASALLFMFASLGEDAFMIIFFCFVAIFGGCALCEVLLATAFGLLAKPQCGSPEEDPISYWMTFSSCFAGYAVLVALDIAAAFLIIAFEDSFPSLLGNYEEILYGTLIIMPLIIALWWWHSLSRALRARSGSSWRTASAELLVPFVVFITVCVTAMLIIHLMD